jgi:hypothetical protein
MAGLFSEPVWGAILFLNGALALVAMWQRSYYWRRAMMFSIACQWGFIGTTFYLSNPASWSVFSFCGWHCQRVGRIGAYALRRA